MFDALQLFLISEYKWPATDDRRLLSAAEVDVTPIEVAEAVVVVVDAGKFHLYLISEILFHGRIHV